jgi:protein kinase A
MMAEKETAHNAFQAIKNKWKQDASKFGSPLPVTKAQSQFPRRLSQSSPYFEEPSTNEEAEEPQLKLNSQDLNEETADNNREPESTQKLKHVAYEFLNKYSSTVEEKNQTKDLRSVSLRTFPTKTHAATNIQLDSPSKTSRGGKMVRGFIHRVGSLRGSFTNHRLQKHETDEVDSNDEVLKYPNKLIGKDRMESASDVNSGGESQSDSAIPKPLESKNSAKKSPSKLNKVNLAQSFKKSSFGSGVSGQKSPSKARKENATHTFQKIIIQKTFMTEVPSPKSPKKSKKEKVGGPFQKSTASTPTVQIVNAEVSTATSPTKAKKVSVGQPKEKSLSSILSFESIKKNSTQATSNSIDENPVKISEITTDSDHSRTLVADVEKRNDPQSSRTPNHAFSTGKVSVVTSTMQVADAAKAGSSTVVPHSSAFTNCDAAVKRSRRKSLRRLKSPGIIVRRQQQRQPLPPGFTIPVFTHSEYEEETIRSALHRNAFFADVPNSQLLQLISAFEPCKFEAGDIIVNQGDEGDCFYIMQSGLVEFTVNEEHVGTGERGTSFGELSLLYSCLRGATVLAMDETHLLRVDKSTFRYLMQPQLEQAARQKWRLLRGVSFLEHLRSSDFSKLSAVMKPVMFRPGDKLVKKGEKGNALYIVGEGRVRRNTDTTDQTLSTGAYFGEHALTTEEPYKYSVIALTQGLLFSIDRESCEDVLGSMTDLRVKTHDFHRLSEIKFIQTVVKQDTHQLAALAKLIREKRFEKGENILVERETSKAALYIIREGRVLLQAYGKADEIIGCERVFGEALMQRAASRSKKSAKSPYTVTATQSCVCGILTLKDFWTVCVTDDFVKTKEKDKEEKEGKMHLKDQEPPSLPTVRPSMELKDLQKHYLLGEGSFGQVWLVSDSAIKDSCKTYAMKIQSKSYLVEQNQVEACIQEKATMQNLSHSFLITLYKTFQDEKFVYMLLDFAQGGELFSLMHEEDASKLSDYQAKFYAICLADALAYMHRNKYVYRDMKPENVMLDSQGYAKLIDFGFCKLLLDEKTFTMCGTPGYLPPEVVQTLGHSFSADWWSLGILIYEMLTGESPFYYEGIDQMALFESIVHDDYALPSGVSQLATDIIGRLLVKDPALRLGSMDRGDSEILEHAWFDELDINALRHRAPSVKVPWIPEVEGPFDTCYFNDWSDLQHLTVDNSFSSANNSELSQRDAKLFEGQF